MTGSSCAKTGGGQTRVAPVVLFVYNRPQHTQRTLEALAGNRGASDTDLFVFCDGPKSPRDKGQTDRVRALVERATGFQRVIARQQSQHKGLARAIVSGVSQVLDEYAAVIVLEDDLVTSPHFLDYMQRALLVYSSRPEIFCVCGYNHPHRLMRIPKRYCHDVYLSLRPSSWGWATWHDRWSQVDWSVGDFARFHRDRRARAAFDRGGADMSRMLQRQMSGELDSWAIRWCYAQFKNRAYALCPVNSYVQNIGHDTSGVHCGATALFDNDLSRARREPELPLDLQPDEEILAAFRSVYAPVSARRMLAKIRLRLGTSGA